MLKVNSEVLSNLDYTSHLIQIATGAQTTLILLPHECCSTELAKQSSDSVVLSICGEASEFAINPKHKAKVGIGIIGLVAKNATPVRISDFQHSTKALGFYNQNVNVESLVAIPIKLGIKTAALEAQTGVLYCDSPEPDFFSPGMVLALEQYADLIARIFRLEQSQSDDTPEATTNDQFSQSVDMLIKQLGPQSIDLIRIELNNKKELENTLGFQNSISTFEKMRRLTRQAIPANYPVMHTATGETLIALDNMVSSFYENKLRIIAAQLSPDNLALDFEFNKFVLKSGKAINGSNFMDNLILKSETKVTLKQKLKRALSH